MLSIDKEREKLFKTIMNTNSLTDIKCFNGFTDKNFVKLFNGERKNILGNAYNCSIGHTSIIKMAKCLKLPFVCIFEDDAFPTKDIYQKLKHYLSCIPNDTDILVMGWSFLKSKPINYSKMYDILKDEIHGSHAYIIFEKAYDRYLKSYNEDPLKASDVMLTNFDNCITYKTKESLFIQYNRKKSNWGCIGYIYELDQKQKWSNTPPKEYEDVEPYILKNETYKNGIFYETASLLLNTNKFNNIVKNEKIILIGGSNSIKTKEYGNYIDSQNNIIRVNTNGIPHGFEKYCGTKTDMILASEWHKVNKIIHENTLQDRTIYLTMDDIKKMNILNYKFTTGFISILLLLSIFDEIEIFGFGLKGDTKYENR